jgi:hypothetical protein
VDQVLEAARAGATATNGRKESSLLDRLPDDWSVHVPSVAVLAAVAWWLLLATRWWGGRDAGAVTGGAILTALAVIAVRPDRRLPRSAVLLAGWLSACAVAVAAFAPTGWAGATNAAEYVCAAWTVACVATAVVRDPRVIPPIAALLVFGVMLEIEEAWLAWWGSEDPTTPITGTFYWYNPFAIYLLPGAVIGLAVGLRRTGPVAWLGVSGFALGSIGIFYSTSRASLACFAVAVVLVLVAHVVSGRREALARTVVTVAGTAVAVWGTGGPPFFPHRASGLPVAGIAARSSSQSLSQNGGYRLDFWREALAVFQRHPVTGGGYHSMATASIGHNPHHWPLSPLAHNGFLQVLSDGGLLLGVPFLVAAAIISWWVLRGLWVAVRRWDFGVNAFVLPLVLGAMLMHSAVDFDWSYPADLMLVAVLAGMVAGRRWSTMPRQADGRRWLMVATVVAGIGLLAVSAVVAHTGDLQLNLPVSSSQGASR